VAAGSALLKQESRVAEILQAVVKAVTIPVTLKIRTGWDPQHRNALKIAQLAEQAGIAALTIHGRTRACHFSGEAEYETIKLVKQQVKIPIIANGDITTPEKAAWVLAYTGADAVMLGRAAQGQPWIFQQLQQFFDSQTSSKPLEFSLIQTTILQHLQTIYGFYGHEMGVRIARKHIGWYFNQLGLHFKNQIPLIYQQNKADQQFALVESLLINSPSIFESP
jgi:tRNA-dihydrouridine synthase B